MCSCSLSTGFATAATNILFGSIFTVSPRESSSSRHRGRCHRDGADLLAASVRVRRSRARRGPWRADALVGLLFVYVLALTVTEAAQVVGTLLVLSLAITPAAAAARLSARTPVVIGISIALALIAADGGLVLSLIHSDVKASVFISAISFAFYVLVRLAARYVLPANRRRRTSKSSGTRGEVHVDGRASDSAPHDPAAASSAPSGLEDGGG